MDARRFLDLLTAEQRRALLSMDARQFGIAVEQLRNATTVTDEDDTSSLVSLVLSEEEEHDESDDDDDDGTDESDSSDGTPPQAYRRVRPTQAFWDRVDANMNRAVVTVYNERTTLAREVQFGIDAVTEPLLAPGSHVLSCPPQGNKSMAIAALAANNSALGAQAMVVVVNDKLVNAKRVAAKVNAPCRRLGVRAVYLSDQVKIARFFAAAKNRRAFAGGRAVPVLACRHDKVGALARALERHDLRNVVLAVDESDAALTRPRNGARLTQREAALYRMMVGEDDTVLGPGARVRSLVHISATHLGTLGWHVANGVPFTAYVVDPAHSRDRGYFTYDQLKPLRVDGRDLFTNGAAAMTSLQKMRTPEFRAMVRAFAEEGRDRPMMMLAVSQFTNSERENAANMHQISRIFLEQYAEHGDADDVVVTVVTGEGVYVYRGADGVPTERARAADNRKRRREGGVERDPETGEVLAVDDVIRALEARTGPKTKLVVVGYGCLQRAVSLRGDQYVVTHMVCLPTKGMKTSDLEQMAMRPGGRTLRLRAERGYDGVTVLMSKPDLELVHRLYAMTKELLESSGTGRAEDLEAWRAREFDPAFRPVIECLRRHAEPSLRVDAAVKRLRVQQQQQQQLQLQQDRPDHDEEIPPYRGTDWQRLLVNYYLSSAGGQRPFTRADYTAEAEEIRIRRHRMTHKFMYDNGYLVRIPPGHTYQLTDKGRAAGEAYMRAAA